MCLAVPGQLLDIKGDDPPIAVRNEYLRLIDGRNKIDKLPVITNANAGAPQFFQWYRIFNINKWLGWHRVIFATKNTSGPVTHCRAAGQQPGQQ